ncbi:MAG: metallophosphoesterase family protein [Anaerolineae bacterium]
MFKFLHLADLHLGCEQYGLKERARDMAAAFRAAAGTAVREHVQFVVIAGDFFHTRNVDPQTLLQAIKVLEMLRDTGIPVVAVAGNHDRGWRSEGYSWLSVLHDLGYLRHLDVDIQKGTLTLNGPDAASPSYVEIGEARILGLPYLGASLPRLLDQFREQVAALPPRSGALAMYNIALAHAGLEGVLPGVSQPLRQEHLLPLRPCIDYVALGHLHKPFERDNWIFNPGSPEALGTDEWQFGGGWYVVSVERDADGSWSHNAEHRRATRRPSRRLPSIDVGYYDTPEALAEAVSHVAGDAADIADRKALVELTLRGRLRFSAAALDLNHLTALVEERLHPLKVISRNLAVPAESMVSPDDEAPRHEIEMRVLRQAIAADSRYEPYQEEMARLALDVKGMALSGAKDEDVFARVVSYVSELAPIPATGPECPDPGPIGATDAH